jgi:uncharacterized protein (TIGR03437 family)
MLRVWLALAVLCAGTAGAAGPSYSAAGIVNASSYTAGPFAPGSVVSIFGSGLARSTHILSADDLSGGNLPLEMNFVRVYVEDQLVPLLFVSAGQINFIMSTVQKTGTARVRVVTEGLTGPEITVNLVDCAPALFQMDGGYAIATSASGKLLTADAPAHPGDIIVVYITGLGRTLINPQPGEVPRAASQIVNLVSLKVAIGPVTLDPALIKYAGLTPGSAGLYQLNLAIPDGVGTDPQIVVTGNIGSGGLKLYIR